MAMLDTPRAKSMAAIVIAVLLGYMAYTGEGLNTFGIPGLKAKKDQAQAMADSLLAITAQTDSLKKDLAKGSVEDLKQKTEAYRATLESLRQLVPEKNEVPGLIDAMAIRAKVRGVHLAAFGPQPVESGPAPFDTYRHQMSVIGHYDQIGEFLTDVAGLKRIIVPIDVRLIGADPTSARALGDTSKSMLEARFFVKTYVKSGPSAPASQGGPRAN
jgi:Tfp pilus assembly protein PilO